MACFPFMMDIERKDCLVVGGGKIAYCKVTDLLQFGARVTVIANEICQEIREVSLEEASHVGLVDRPFMESDLTGRFFVIAATNDEELNRRISKNCMDLGILVNAVDIKDACSFIFPAMIKKDELVEGTNLIYAAGAEHRTLGAKGEMDFAGKGVSYCATCDGSFFKGKDVAVVGGGNTAIDDALYLSEIASSVTLLHRRGQFRAAQTTVEKLQAKENVTIKTGVNIQEISGGEHLEKGLLDNSEEISVNGLFIAVGMVPQTELVKECWPYS